MVPEARPTIGKFACLIMVVVTVLMISVHDKTLSATTQETAKQANLY